MMGKLKYFPAFLSLRPILARLSLDEVGEVFLGALQYADEGTIPDLDSTPAIVLEFIRQDIDRAQESYDELCAKNRENGAKNGKKSDGYRPLPMGTDRYRPLPMGTDGTERECNANANENEKETEISLHAEQTQSDRFDSPGRGPSLEEVRSFVRESGLNVDPDDYHEKRVRSGWRNKNGRYVGGDWQSDVRRWARYQKEPVKARTEPKPQETSFSTDDFFDAAVRAGYAKYGFDVDANEEET